MLIISYISVRVLAAKVTQFGWVVIDVNGVVFGISKRDEDVRTCERQVGNAFPVHDGGVRPFEVDVMAGVAAGAAKVIGRFGGETGVVAGEGRWRVGR